MAAMPRERSVGGTEICGLEGGKQVCSKWRPTGRFKDCGKPQRLDQDGSFLFGIYFEKIETMWPVIGYVPVMERSWHLCKVFGVFNGFGI